MKNESKGAELTLHHVDYVLERAHSGELPKDKMHGILLGIGLASIYRNSKIDGDKK